MARIMLNARSSNAESVIFFGPYGDKKGCYSTCVEDENLTLPQILFSAPRNKIKKTDKDYKWEDYIVITNCC